MLANHPAMQCHLVALAHDVINIKKKQQFRRGDSLEVRRKLQKKVKISIPSICHVESVHLNKTVSSQKSRVDFKLLHLTYEQIVSNSIKRLTHARLIELVFTKSTKLVSDERPFIKQSETETTRLKRSVRTSQTMD